MKTTHNDKPAITTVKQLATSALKPALRTGLKAGLIICRAAR